MVDGDERGDAVGEVELEVMPLIAPSFGGSGAEHLRLAEPVETGEPLRAFLDRLTAKYPAIAGTVYDPAAHVVEEHVRLMLNDELIELVGGLDVPLRPGDRLLILPAFAGG